MVCFCLYFYQLKINTKYSCMVRAAVILVDRLLSFLRVKAARMLTCTFGKELSF